MRYLCLILSLCLFFGCAQSTDPFQLQEERTVTPTDQTIVYNINNGPADSDRGAPSPPTTQPWEFTRESPADGEGKTTSKLPAGAYNQFTLIWNDTGSESRTSGEQTGTQTSTPTQDVKADVGISLLVQLLQGLVNQASGSPSAAGAGDSAATLTAQQELRDMLKDLLKDFGKQEPTSQPE